MRLGLLVVIGLLAAGIAVAVQPEERQSLPTFEPARLRDGTAAAYQMTLTGGWHYDGMEEGVPMAGPRFELAGIDEIPDRQGDLVQAMRVVWEGPTTTLLPPVDGPSWRDERGVHWMDGTRVAWDHAQGERLVRQYPPTTECLLVAVTAGPLPPCEFTGLRIALEGVDVRKIGLEEDGRLQLMHFAAQGDVDVHWWMAPGVAVPMRVEATAPGAPGLGPRTVVLELTALLPGTGADAPPASAIAGTPLAWGPRHAWGPDDRGLDHPFPLSQAYAAARSSMSWPDLREWMADHPRAYVFMAEYSERQEDALHCTWRIHLTDGQHGFSLRATKSHAPAPLLPDEVRFARLATSSLAAAAPSPADAPQQMPRVASVWERWADHAGPRARDGANLWGFQILQGQEEPLVQYAAGAGRSLRWGLHGLEHLGLAGQEEEASLVVLDGKGHALRYEETRPAGAPAPHASAPYVPAALPYLAPAWPWTATASGVAALVVLVLLPKFTAMLFTRFQPHELLDHPVRAAVMDAVRGEPGIHFRALCTRLDRNPGQVRHHVRKLVEGRLLVAQSSPGYTCYFPYQGTPRALMRAGPLVRSGGARSLLGALTSRPGACSKDLALAAGLSAATATYHLKRLQQVGLVDARRDGKAVRMHLTPEGQQAAAMLA